MSSHESFGDFFASWMSRLEEDLLPLLLSASNYPIPPSREHEAFLRRLIADVTLHHRRYYAEKWACCEASGGGGDVFAFFSMPWMTSLERAYSWITGWKPSAAFRIVESLREGKAAHLSRAFRDVTEEQAGRIERLREAIRMEEDKVERDLERQQVALGDRKMVELVFMASSVKEGDEEASAEVGRKVEEAIKEVGAGMEKVMKAGDSVRLRTLGGLMEVLSPSQGVGFLGALTFVLLRMRDQGLKRSWGNSSVAGNDTSEPTERA